MTRASRPSKLSDDDFPDAEGGAGLGIADAVEPHDEDDGALPDFDDDDLEDWDDDDDDFALGDDFDDDEDFD